MQSNEFQIQIVRSTAHKPLIISEWFMQKPRRTTAEYFRLNQAEQYILEPPRTHIILFMGRVWAIIPRNSIGNPFHYLHNESGSRTV